MNHDCIKLHHQIQKSKFKLPFKLKLFRGTGKGAKFPKIQLVVANCTNYKT